MMVEDMAHDNSEFDGSDLNEADVIRYLMLHPEFLLNHIEILRRIAPREEWSGDAVVDLQSIMVDRSQEAIDDLRSAAQSVIETSRSNMSIQTRCHSAIVALLNADTFDELVQVITQEWPHMLDVDVVTLGFEFTRAPFPAMINENLKRFPLGTIRQLLGADTNVRLFDDMIDDGTLFGEAHGIAQSAVVGRIEAGFELPPGLLSLGARDDTFAPGQGTELLVFLTDVVAASVRRCLTRKG